MAVLTNPVVILPTVDLELASTNPFFTYEFNYRRDTGTNDSLEFYEEDRFAPFYYDDWWDELSGTVKDEFGNPEQPRPFVVLSYNNFNLLVDPPTYPQEGD